MAESTISFIVLGMVVVLFVWNRLPVEVVAVGASVALWATGVLDLNQALSGFGDPTVVFIASLFVVSEALDATGVTTWAGLQLGPRVGRSRSKLLVATVLLVAGLTALISVNGAVAALLPMVVVLAVRLGTSPSLLMMPLAFGAHAGSMLALTGTPVNVIVSEAAEEATGQGFGFFEFTLVGIPLLAGTLVIVVFLGPRLLPKRSAKTLPVNLAQHATTMVEQYGLDDVSRLRIGADSPLLGRRPTDVDLSAFPGAVLVGVQPGTASPGRSRDLAEGDVLLVQGSEAVIARVTGELGVAPLPPGPTAEVAEALVNREGGVVEVIVRPRSGLVGETVFPGMVTESGELVILAVQRRGEQLGPGEIELAAGDALLVQGSWQALDENTADPDVLVVDEPGLVRRQAVPLGPRSGIAIAIVGAMVVLLATGVIPAAMSALLAAGALVVLRVVPLERAYRSISWTTVLLVGGMIPLSIAIEETGAAAQLADLLVNVVGDAGPYALVLGLFVLTATLGQLISNTATALVVIPIAVSAAVELDVSARPVLMSVTVAAAASFLTPVATPANMMVMGPGGYRFGDYWKLGLPMILLSGVVAVLVVPVFWPF